MTAIVEPKAESRAALAHQLNVQFTAATVAELHELHDDKFDVWLTNTPAGWLIVPQANRPLPQRLDQWKGLPAGWMWGQTFRYLPRVQAVKASLNTGKLGMPGLVRIHHWQSLPAGDARIALLPQLDLACWLVDQPPTMLFAQSRSLPTNEHVSNEDAGNDYIQVHLGFADHRMAMVDCSTSLIAGDPYFSLSVIGASGAAYADDHHNMQLCFGNTATQALATGEGDGALRSLLEEYLQATSERRLPACNVTDWRRAWQLRTAALESLRTGLAVPLQIGEP